MKFFHTVHDDLSGVAVGGILLMTHETTVIAFV